MNSSRRLSIVGSIVLLVIALAAARVTTGQSQQPGESPAEATRRIVSAATALMASLDDASRAKVQFPFSGSQRERWSNFPSGIFQRQGLRLADLTPSQNAAVMTVLQAALSGPGFQKVVNIMEGDDVLRRTGGGNGPGRGGRGGPPPGNQPPGDAGPPQGAAGPGRGGPGDGVVFGKDEYYLAFVGTPSATDAVDAAVRRAPSRDQPDAGRRVRRA